VFKCLSLTNILQAEIRKVFGQSTLRSMDGTTAMVLSSTVNLSHALRYSGKWVKGLTMNVLFNANLEMDGDTVPGV
jgi:hypothetical protein